MKLLSLQKKTNILIWSVILGLSIDRILFFTAGKTHTADPDYWTGGFPLQYYDGSAEFEPLDIQRKVQNIIVWILAVFLVLSLIRYFSYKKSKVKKPT